MSLNRRTFIAAGAAAVVARRANAAQPASQLDDVPIIETTVHIFDPSRPQSTPYMPNSAGVSTEQYRQKAAKGIVGAISVESSPWIEDNLWLLETCARDPFMVGIVGNLKPEAKEFPEYIERYNKHPMYLGIRYGNIWGYNIVEQSTNPAFIEGLKVLAQADMVLDAANPLPDLFQAVVRISDAVPNLRIVVNHLLGFHPTREEMAPLKAVLKEFQKRPQIYGKLSGLTSNFRDPPTSPSVPTLAEHKDRIDLYYEPFGAERTIGGSYSTESIAVMKEYFAKKPRAAAEGFFWRNSAKVYKWTPRTPNQPKLA